MSQRLLQDGVRQQAQRRPDAVAVVDGAQRTSYGDLDRTANQLAHLLLAAGAGRGDRIAILAPKGTAAITAMLATLRAGCAYVPLDPQGPAPRQSKILHASEPRVVLATAAAQPLLDAILGEADAPRCTVASLEHAAFAGERFATEIASGDAAAQPAAAPSCGSQGADPAHILFTSGSTGTPKGVVITHANVLAFLDWALPHFGIRDDDRCSSHPPLHFDLSTFDVWGTLTAGGELHPIPPQASLVPHRLAELIRARALTQWFSVPSILAYMASLGAVREHDFPALRRVLWCGEVLPAPVLAHWMQRVPHARYTNLYGPTEATIASTWFDVPAPPADLQAPVPIGRACGGEDVDVLDPDLRPLPAGELGEICIRGQGLSPGYWRDAEKTAAAFVHDDQGRRTYRTGDLGTRDAHGLLHFAGRRDAQIKSRGYRIELGEIEAALHTLASLQEAAVVAIPTDGFDGHAICCAYVGRDPAPSLAPAALRAELARLLPAYMLPSRWLALACLPRNHNGKVDRPELRRRFTAERHAAASPEAAAREG